MDFLKEIKNFDVDGSKNLRLKGKMRNYTTYRIPIEMLKYNKKNDRIASFMSEYAENHDIDAIDEDTIEGFIFESSERNKRTLKNIKAIGQIEPAVVMSDGVVVDGNRRFTCLRKLYRETKDDKYKYIVAAVLDKDVYEDKDIKKLELQIQNVEEKVKYNPIDRYVGIYRNIIREPQEFSIEEYASDSNKKVSEIKEEVLLTTLMIKYLEFINKPLKFHYARKNDLDGTINEMKSMERSTTITKEDKHITEELCFSGFASGIDSKKIRELLDATKNKDVFDEQRKNEAKELNNQVYNSCHEEGFIDESLKEKSNDFVIELIEDNGLSKEKNKDENQLEKALNNIKKIDKEVVVNMNEEHRTSFDKKLASIRNELDALERLDHAKK